MSEEERAVIARAVEQINAWLLASPLEEDDDMIAVPAGGLAGISFALDMLIDREPFSAPPAPTREAIARALYECERKRSDHADAVLSAAAGKPVMGMRMEPWEECCDTFLSDADAILALSQQPPVEKQEADHGG